MRQTDTRSHYAQVANDVLSSLNDSAVIGCSSCCDTPATAAEAHFLYATEALAQLPEGAKAASRGCGDPIAKADLREGERVLDLGCGGGIDALIASKLVGATGQVFGIDMTEEMVELAKENAQNVGAANVEFLTGCIEQIPLPDACVDVVISNCVINFCEHKQAAFAEAARVLNKQGRLVISDIVAFGVIPSECEAACCHLTGCTNGISTPQIYKTSLEAAGFTDITLEAKTIYTLEVLKEKALRKDRMDSFAQIEHVPGIDGLMGSALITARKEPKTN